jgi:uncharacterized glyoxalase superfamily protein PhnB
MLKYNGSLFVVDEIAPSRRFYEELLGQTVRFDFGENVTFEGGFSIHQRAHFQRLLGDEDRFHIGKRAHNVELFFETDELEVIDARLREAGVEYLHPVQTQPWEQCVLRVYDPGGHIIEIGEKMESTVLRLDREGMSQEQIIKRTGMPIEFVKRALREGE